MTEPRMCYLINEAQDPKVHDGYVPSVVFEGEPGHRPMTGQGEGCRPWIWGQDLSAAQMICAAQNKEMGLSTRDVEEIIDSSMPANY